jgi:hypothetical protein
VLDEKFMNGILVMYSPIRSTPQLFANDVISGLMLADFKLNTGA